MLGARFTMWRNGIGSILLWSCLFVLPCVAQSTPASNGKIRLLQQLGSPIAIDASEVRSDSVLRWSQITNQSDRAVKAVTLGCFVQSPNGQIAFEIGMPNEFGRVLRPGASTELPPQDLAKHATKPAAHVIFFVARAQYDDNSEYVADIAAMRATLFRKAQLQTGGGVPVLSFGLETSRRLRETDSSE